MRDILLSGILLGLLPYILRFPVVGAYTWAWLSMMSPHRAVYGFARGVPFAQLVAIVTLISLLMSRDRRPVPMTTPTVVLLLMLSWMTFTSFFAIADTDRVIDRWIFVGKSQIMIFITMMLVRDRMQIHRLMWVVVGSIAFYGVKGGVWTLATGGGGRVWGPPGLLEGNNELAVALVMMVPLMVYTLQTATKRWIRWGLIVAIGATCFGILGSQSRGALLAIVAMAFFLALKGKRPVLMSLVIIALLLTAIAFMPESWTQRMDTIQTFEADNSAQSRIYTWRTLLNCALDRPLVGAGFAADNLLVFSRYAPGGAEYAPFDGLVFVAHSIYFQMLGEHGFVGLALFLLLGVVTWRRASQLTRATRGDAEFGRWVPLLMPMIQVSLIGYAVGGAFLSLAYLDVPYYVLALVILVDAHWRDHQKTLAAAKAAPSGTAANQNPAAVVTAAT
ncbi:putative O-glycosylation ligase, exosortase A system-associated [Ideonella sp. A 288]|uniref:putative O-glycosylation ligase, exosortase A system-associated n=1 Tax=Ideonella sp. A 288 TaxID=1962181 RepID=UPI000B4A7B82|nr:putative O-glycosylation ligase, exosortase A system-associated [Ideonella sp. A 288]